MNAYRELLEWNYFAPCQYPMAESENEMTYDVYVIYQTSEIPFEIKSNFINHSTFL